MLLIALEDFTVYIGSTCAYNTSCSQTESNQKLQFPRKALTQAMLG